MNGWMGDGRWEVSRFGGRFWRRMDGVGGSEGVWGVVGWGGEGRGGKG